MTPVSWAAVHTLSSSEVAHGSTLFNVNHNTAASAGAALMSVILTRRLNGSASIAAANRADSIREEAARRGLPPDLSKLPSQVLAATAIPASFLPKKPAPRVDRTSGI
jgi:MFS transporter, DHA2 family, multidrug resistance protein